MKLFADLKVNQAVKVGAVFVVSLPRGDYLSPDGNKVSFDAFENQFSADSINGWLKIVKPPKSVIEFVFEDGLKVSVDAYKELLQKNASYYDDDYEECVYPDLETEFEIKKQLEAFNRAEKIYSDPTESHEEVTFEVVGAAKDSGSQFITSPIQYGRVSWNSGAGIWKVDCGKIAKDAFEKATVNITDKELPTHSNITYAKVKGKYAFTNDEKRFDWIKNVASTFITDSLEKAYEKEEFIRGYVVNRINMFLDEHKVGEQTVLDIWESLKTIHSQVSQIDPKQKSLGNKRGAVRAINDLMSKLENK